ncbi:MAG: 1-(5-phosphoribosyl)-5-[(5-phosphoribosylamino)methylideneamino]imidazole-4-carboxamide isomerase [Ectothiorhodospiraceae bacterium]|nr:1-(5-phosphoribosyl)-5-[(5-phosphoribosylamino)methylideneamino]imidazole-4-carboxamide isomerase [Chromatiales bacterium]MCP5157300.1 1-(5-phosphoribosyl)-5-[(5-phosphoribosylamino)methylideneamino]imidazole-4-carboxamide isomerase [Ectothiorhodospiraceae bacterium]
MLIIPAIDLKGGRCVRLRQGRMDDETVYSDDPVATARRWVEEGARRLHIVDLDGAMKGQPVNADVIGRMVAACPDLPIQVGGGVRDDDDVQAYLDAGVSYVIVGSKAVTAPHMIADLCVEYPGRIIVALDARDGRVAVDGWSKLSQHDVIDLAQRLQDDGVEAFLYTDIGRDGMMSGVNVEATVRLARAISVPVIASGGVRDMDDIRALGEVAEEGVLGVVTGRALYEGTLDLGEAQRAADAAAS